MGKRVADMTPEEVERRKATQRRYHEANREKILESQRRYREANREKILATQRRRREANCQSRNSLALFQNLEALAQIRHQTTPQP